ncbi:MAG: hypothetical protein PHF79_02540 [Candidatus Pacebacteria bacterium]|nr:hypothetical protein [Candidatus Paceibacterota bacterium]
MNIDHQLMGKIACGLATLGFLPYVISIFKGRCQVSKAGWIIWTVIGASIFLSYKTSGAKASAWVPLSYAICPALVLAATFYKSRSKEPWPLIDKTCLVTGLVLFAPWVAFKILEKMNALPSWGGALPGITLYGTILVDAFGALPTIWKSWKNPGSEDPWAWVLWTSANLLNLFAVETWAWNIASYAVYMATPSVLILPSLIAYRVRGMKMKIQRKKLSSAPAPADP